MQEAGSLFENRPLPLVAEASSYQRSSSSVPSLRLSYPGPAKPVVVTLLVNRTWPQWLLQVRCPALGLSVSVSGEGWSLGSITAATRPSRAMNARTIMAIP